MSTEATQAKQLRDVDYALSHLASLSAKVEFKPADHSMYGRDTPAAIVRIHGSEKTVERNMVADDGNHNVAWLVEIGNAAFEMHIDLVNEKHHR